MQAIIMAGGKGTRLRSITGDTIPKPMALICGKPILEWQIEQLRENGITDVIMVIGHLGSCIQEYFKDGSAYGMTINYYQEEEPLGTAGAVHYLLGKLEENFFLIFGDVIWNIDLKRMQNFHMENKSKATLFIHSNSHPYDSDLVITDNKNRITEILGKKEKRTEWFHNQVNAGFYMFHKSAFRSIKGNQKIDLESDVILPMIKNGENVFGYRSPEYIKDVGTPERIYSVEEDLKNKIVEKRNLKNKQKCIFLDRDGTINRYKGLLYKVEDFELEKDVGEAIRMINHSGWLAIVVTNQPVVARGLCDIKDVEIVHKKLEDLLGKQGAYLDDIVFCPHHPDKGYPEENALYKIECDCRKPKIGMIKYCEKKYNIDLKNSWIIGDTSVDMQTGSNAGMHTGLVLTGMKGMDKKYTLSPEKEGKTLLELVNKIL